MVLLTFERPVHSTRALARCQNDGSTLLHVPTKLVYLKFMRQVDPKHDIHNTPTMQEVIHISNFALFSDPVICLFIIVLLVHAL